MGVCLDKIAHSCGSSDGLQVFEADDGTVNGFCFACDTYEENPYGDPRQASDLPPPKRPVKSKEDVLTEMTEIAELGVMSIKGRRLRDTYLEHFGVKVGVSQANGKTPNIVFFPYTKNGGIVKYKVRLLEPKKMWSVGFDNDVDLFGWEQALESGAKRLIITEGEFDAVAMQAIVEIHTKDNYKDFKPAICSLPNGAGNAKRDLTRLLPKIKRHFKDISFAFDTDEAGQKGLDACCVLYPEARVIDLPAKDANACLLENKGKAAFKSLTFNADKPKNTRLVWGGELHEEAKEAAEWGLSWPWEYMTEKTRGIRFGETYYLGAGEKIGKALAYSTVVPTPSGMRKWEDIQVGDELFGSDGNPVKVTNRFDQGLSQIYEVCFSDGSSCFTTASHNWSMYNRRGVSKKVTTKEMRGWGLGGRFDRFHILPAVALYPKKDLSIDPYTLGAWLGDGHHGDGRMTNPDDYIWGRVNEAYKLGKDLSYGGCRCHTILNLQHLLPIRDKHIPREYLESSVAQRTALLQGLMDTDGWCEKGGTVMFGSTTKPIYDGFVSLVRSLGGVVRELKVKETGFKPFHQCSVVCPDTLNPFSLPRKASRVREAQPGRLWRRVVDIKEVHQEQAMCVTVDAEDHLFLANDYITTHNSEVVNALAAHCITEHSLKILLAKPEEANKKSYKMLVSKVVGKFFHDPSVKFDEAAYDRGGELVKDNVCMLNLYQNLSWEVLKADIHSAVGMGVKAVFIDPITNLTNGMSSSEVNETLQGVAQELAAMAKDLDIVIFIFCHLNKPPKGSTPWDRGGKITTDFFAGSSAMARSCNYALGLQGNRDPELDPDERNMRELVLLADREFGEVGTCRLYWDRNTGLFNEVGEHD